MEEQELLLTPLHEEHLKLRARMIPFDGFDMPVQYTGIIEEHFFSNCKMFFYNTCVLDRHIKPIKWYHPCS